LKLLKTQTNAMVFTNIAVENLLKSVENLLKTTLFLLKTLLKDC
jgi:hypothetical protein